MLARPRPHVLICAGELHNYIVQWVQAQKSSSCNDFVHFARSSIYCSENLYLPNPINKTTNLWRFQNRFLEEKGAKNTPPPPPPAFGQKVFLISFVFFFHGKKLPKMKNSQPSPLSLLRIGHPLSNPGSATSRIQNIKCKFYGCVLYTVSRLLLRLPWGRNYSLISRAGPIQRLFTLYSSELALRVKLNFLRGQYIIKCKIVDIINPDLHTYLESGPVLKS